MIDHTAWLEQQFEFEYCNECGYGAAGHEVIEVLGNPFARCKHPIPVNQLDNVAAVIAVRIAEQENAHGDVHADLG